MAVSNLEKYRKDLESLLDEAAWVSSSLQHQIYGEKFYASILKQVDGDEEKAKAFFKRLKPFQTAYQHWYSEALPLVRQLLPDRLSDFVRFYEKPKARKELTQESYRIEDACQGLRAIAFNGEVKADASAAISLLSQQVAIVEAIKRRFDSSLFDIKQLVQADVFDSELDGARELLKNKYARAAGAIAGVVLEGHLKQVCDNHGIPKKSGTIAVLNEGLKAANIIELSQHRQIQFLGDIRNKCGHKNATEPTIEEVDDLINGVVKVIKTVF